MVNGMYYFNTVGLLLISAMKTSKVFILKFPFRARLLTSKKSQFICLLMWTAAFIYVVPAFVIEGGDILFDHRTYDCKLGFSDEVWRWLKPSLVGSFAVITNLIVIITTASLLKIAGNFARRKNNNMKWQGIITTKLVALVYFVSIFPYTIFTVIRYSGASFAYDPYSFFRFPLTPSAISTFTA